MDFKETYNDGTIRVARSEHGWSLKVRPAVTTLLIRNGKVILIEDKKTDNDHWLWNCPGGMIEPGETSEQAAVRECEEETGIIPTSLEKFATIKTDFPDTFVDYYIGSELKQGKVAPWVGTSDEMIGKIKDYTWTQLHEFATNYQLRDPRLVVALLQLARKPSLLEKYNLA